MNFDSPEMVETIAYDMKLGDWPRALQRARINDIANGKPPYTQEEVRENKITININDLEHTRSCQHARAQFYSAFCKPAHYFQARTDSGPKHKRQEWNSIATSQAARIMKRSLPYFESIRSRFALDVLHGIGPSAYEDRDKWCPDPLGIEDVLIPSDTYLTMKNLPFFFFYKSLTGPELIKLTTGPRVDPGWNLDLVQSCLEWLDSEMMQLRTNTWPEQWAPEKAEERIKSNGGWYAGDQAPRIDCFDFYFWSDEGRDHGWRRRMILDPWSTPEAAGGAWSMSRKSEKPYTYHRRNATDPGGFLFNPGKRKYASKLSELVNFQFADLSAVSPFRYHSVRSLGWLLFATCHMQNRLRCAVNKHIFQNLMQFFSGSSQEDFQRALKVELIDMGFIDNSIKMIPQAERWQINSALAELGLQENKQIISNAASAWSQTSMSNDRTEKTKFQVMAEVSAMTSMISAGLLQAFVYHESECREIWRRLCRKNSRDPDVREFRANCLRLGIPEENLIAEAWDIEVEKTMGAGNKTMELAIAEQLLAMRNFYDPAAQREILRDATLLITDDAVRTRAYVPEGPRPVSNSQHEAEMAMGAILQGQDITPVEGENHKEVIDVWMGRLAKMIAIVEKRGGMAQPQEIVGMRSLEKNIQKQIAIVAKDEEQKEQVKKWEDALGKMMNFVKAYEQRLQEQMQKQAEAAQQSNGGLDPKDRAKIQGALAMAQVKAENLRQSHGLKMAQRKLQFEEQLQQDRVKAQAEIAKQDIQTAAEIKREHVKNAVQSRMKSFSE